MGAFSSRFCGANPEYGPNLSTTVDRRRHLRALLHAYLPTTDGEEQYRARMLDLSESPDAMTRTNYTPGHFTASAFVVSPDRGRILLIFHSKLQRWLQPGGHVDPRDQDILGAARREVEEEVGLSKLSLIGPGIFDLDVHLIPARGDAPAHEHFDVRFAFASPSLEHRAGSDASAARWIDIAEVKYVDSDESVLRAARKLAAQHSR
jgi:8-oxo-dGTP pyrophosphatase MutT (NUDIX family)